MNKIVFLLMTGFSLISSAQIMSFCDNPVQQIASGEFNRDFPNQKVSSVSSNATHYVGWHTKIYYSDVIGTDLVATYEAKVFEYETPSTNCVIDSVVLSKVVKNKSSLENSNPFFLEGTYATFNLNLKNIIPGYSYLFEVKNLADFSGAAFDSNLNQFSWRPPIGASGAEGYSVYSMDVLVKAIPYNITAKSIFTTESVAVHVLSRL